MDYFSILDSFGLCCVINVARSALGSREILSVEQSNVVTSPPCCIF